MTETPIADWLLKLKPGSVESAKPAFEGFLTFWHMVGHQAGKCPTGAWHDAVVYGPEHPKHKFGVLEDAADDLLQSRFQDLANPNPEVRFTIDNLAAKWFGGMVSEKPESRNTFETRLGWVMSFFKYHRCPILPQVEFRRETTRRKYIGSIQEIRQIAGGLVQKYRVYVMLIIQTGARPSSILQLKVADVERFLDTDFYVVHFRRSKKGRKGGYFGFVGPEVGLELLSYLRSRGLTEENRDAMVFDFTDEAASRAWTKSAQSVGLDKTMQLNGKTTHMFHIYTIRSFFKNCLDAAGISKDWVDLLMGHKLSAADAPYTPGMGIFEAWKRAVYERAGFMGSPLVSEALGQRRELEQMKEKLERVVEIIKSILGPESTALALPAEERERLLRQLVPA